MIQSLEDQQWLSISEAADAKLEEAALQSDKALEETLAFVAKSARDAGVGFVDSLLTHMSRISYDLQYV